MTPEWIEEPEPDSAAVEAAALAQAVLDNENKGQKWHAVNDRRALLDQVMNLDAMRRAGLI
jgi:hypothetical protein